MNRIDRLTAIIIFLQGRSRVKVDELAERYDISRRTVYRDLRALQEAGVPLGSEEGKGYFIIKGYHMPPVMFNKNEAAALLAGERLMQKWGETKLGKSYATALDKIRAVLRYKEKEYLDILDRHIKAVPYHDETNIEYHYKCFPFLQDAIVRKKVVHIEYYAAYKDEITHRDIEPLGLLLRSNRWYVAAWCRMRTDYRMFRVDRIERFSNTANHFKDEHSLKAFSERSLHKEEDLKEVTIRFNKEMIRYMGDQKFYYGWTAERNVAKGVEMDFLAHSIEYFARWLLMWGNGAEVIKPNELKDRVREISEELFNHHAE